MSIFGRLGVATVLFVGVTSWYSLQAQPDSTYVETYPGTWSLRGYGIVKAQQLQLNSSNDASIHYLPDNILGLGIGISYRRLVLDLGATLGSSENISQRFDFQGNVFLFPRSIAAFIQPKAECRN